MARNMSDLHKTYFFPRKWNCWQPLLFCQLYTVADAHAKSHTQRTVHLRALLSPIYLIDIVTVREDDHKTNKQNLEIKLNWTMTPKILYTGSNVWIDYLNQCQFHREMVKTLDSCFEISGFEFQSRQHVHPRTITLEKEMNLQRGWLQH